MPTSLNYDHKIHMDSREMPINTIIIVLLEVIYFYGDCEK